MSKKRVRLHLKEDGLPSVEGFLVRRWGEEYVVALPQLLVAPHAKPAELSDARWLAVPKANVAFYEVLR